MGLSSYLGVLKDGRVTVVEVAEHAGSPYLEDFEVGLDVSAHATALGKALLVGMTPQERHSFLVSHELRPFTPRTCTEPEGLEAELGAVAQAPVTEHGEFRDGVSCTAALVPSATAGGPGMGSGRGRRRRGGLGRIATEVTLAAADLAGSRASSAGQSSTPTTADPSAPIVARSGEPGMESGRSRGACSRTSTRSPSTRTV